MTYSNHASNFSISDLYKKDSPVTPVQSGAFNTLLTNLSKHIYELQQEHDLPTFLLALIKEVKAKQPSDSGDSQDDFENIVCNWQILLNHIYCVLLPELYVFFHDDSCTTGQRQKVHRATDNIWQLCKTWQFDTSNQPSYTPLQKDIISQNSTALPAADDYLIGRGDNANIACRILPLAKLSNVEGFHYLEQLQPLFQVLSEKKWLLSFLSQDSIEVGKQLDIWQSQRLATFSIPDAQTLYAQPDLLRINNDHPLVSHIQKNMGDSYIVKVGKNTHHVPSPSLNQQHNQSANQPPSTTTSTTNTNIPMTRADNRFVVDSKELIKGLIFSAIGFGLVFFDPFSLLNMILAVVAIPFLVIAPTHLSSAIVNRQDNTGLLRIIGTLLLFSPVLMVFGGKLLAVGLFGLILGFSLRMGSSNAKDDTSSRPQQSIRHQPQQLYQPTKHSGDDTNNSILLPINLHRHAFHLAQLLSEDSLALLQQLISAINESHAHLDYLQEHHPYLANSVHELIMDLTINSILRLNQMAQNLVKNGKASDSAKAMFADNHEQQVNALLQNHLEEIESLNASILEKQMAGFATVGSEAERKFRDSVMELKILLNWFIAQAPDNGVSSYEIILNKLEESTLKQMQEVFYKHDTTAEQREQLQEQIDDLLAHFQAQSPKAEHQQAGDDLLQLTHDPNLLYQSETQQFIDFNKQYVKQLQQHWH